MSDVSVVKIRLKRSLLKELKELAKDESFTVAEAIRAAIKVGMVPLRANKQRIKSIESGVISAEDVLGKWFPKSDAPKPEPETPNHGFPPDYRDDSQELVEWISGTGEGHPLKQMERAKTIEHLRETVASLGGRLNAIENAWLPMIVHDQDGDLAIQDVPFHYFSKAKALAKQQEISDEEALKQVLKREGEEMRSPGGPPVKITFGSVPRKLTTSSAIYSRGKGSSFSKRSKRPKT